MMKFRIVLLLITAGLFVTSADAADMYGELIVNGGFEADYVADGTWLEAVPSGWLKYQWNGTKGAIWNPAGTGTGAGDYPGTGVNGNIFMAGPLNSGYTKQLVQMWDVNISVGDKVTLTAIMVFP
jgi:hypothetical protein